MKSLLKQKNYSQEWVKDFYTQAGIWWGEDAQPVGEHQKRLETITRLRGEGTWRILDLGAGPGRTAAALADAGHDVIAVEINPTDIQYAHSLLNFPHKGSLEFVEADFYTVALKGCFDVVTCWQVFGLGSDSDQRRLLRRIAGEWLAPDGIVIMDVYNPAGPAREAGHEWHLNPIKGVPGSVEMTERCHYDPVHGYWIDEWEPVEHPEHSLAQSVRCYTPADLILLLEGTGLKLQHVEMSGEVVDVQENKITTNTTWFEKDNNYLAVLRN